MARDRCPCHRRMIPQDGHASDAKDVILFPEVGMSFRQESLILPTRSGLCRRNVAR